MCMLTSTRRCLNLLEKCKNLKQLTQAHAQLITCGLGQNTFALSRLLFFCSDPNHSFKIFNRIQNPTPCIFNTMIKAFSINGELSRSVEVYKGMLRIGICPDNYTIPYLLKCCGNSKRLDLGVLIHAQCLRFGLMVDSYVGNSLIVMYSVLGDMRAARYVFDEMPSQCVVSWTVMISGYSKRGDVYEARLVFDETPVKDLRVWGAMISGYVQNNCFKEGLQLFRLMQGTGVEPDEAIIVSVLSACAHLGSLDIGKWIHRYMEKSGVAMNARSGTALVDMYAKCGRLDLAWKLFDEMPERDVIAWNAMISALAMNGDGERALMLFEEMRNAGTRPDDVTFVSLFTACSYSGMPNEALRLLKIMCNVYRIRPKGEHFGCIIDLLSRNGLLEEAKDIVLNMPRSSSPAEEAVAWRALLSSCANLGQVRLAEIAAEKIVELERHSGAYVLLSNIYTAVGKHDGAERMRKMMKKQHIDKTPGCSSVEINGVVHEFVAGEKTHPLMEQVHGLLLVFNRQADDIESWSLNF